MEAPTATKREPRIAAAQIGGMSIAAGGVRGGGVEGNNKSNLNVDDELRALNSEGQDSLSASGCRAVFNSAEYIERREILDGRGGGGRITRG